MAALWLAGTIAAVVGTHPATAAHAAIGSPVGNMEMPLADGGTAFALQDAGANVLVFVRARQERSVTALRELARCQAGFAGKPVRWSAVVSGSAAAGEAAAMLRESGFAAPLLVDRGDALYGSLGIALHPVVVIVGRDRRLAAFEPFRSVDFCTVVAAQLRAALHEISPEQLAAALAPANGEPGSPGQLAAQRYRALAEALLRDGQHDKALESARRSVARDAAAAAGHTLVGRILVAQGNCAEAMPAFERALAIDAGSAAARAGLEQCRARR